MIIATGTADSTKTENKALLPIPEDNILRLEARVQSVRILPAESADRDPVQVFTGPMDVDLLSLSSVAALLSTTTAPAGTYEGIEVKISAATMLLASSPDEPQALALANNGAYSLPFTFEIAQDSSGLLYIELGGLNVFQQDDGSYLLAPNISAALRESVPDTRLEGSIASVDSASKSLVLSVGNGSFTVNYDGADIFLPSDYDTPTGTEAILVPGTVLAVTGTAGLEEIIAPESIEVLDLPGTPGNEDGGQVSVCYVYGENPVAATTITVGRDRLQNLLAQGSIAGPCDDAEPFTLTYAAGPGGTLSGEVTQHVVPGTNSTAVVAVPNEGFAFVSWSDGSTLNPRIEFSVGSDIAVTANFAELFNLTYSAGVGGTLVGDTAQQVLVGGNGSPVTAVRNTGYIFKDWSDGRTDNPRSDLNVTADLSVTATFLRTVTLTYTASAGGTLEGVTLQSFLQGLDGTPVTAVPGEGFIFVGWSDGRTDNPRSDLDVMDNVTVTANFVAQFTLTYTAGPNGSITGATTQIVNGGSDGSPVTAVPDAEFGFVGWSDGRRDNPRTDESVAGDVTVTATFAPSIVLVYNAGPYGTLSGDTEQLIGSGGTSSPVTAVPNPGFGFNRWSDGRTDNPRVDEDVTAAIEVTAEFVQTFTLAYTAGSNGTLTGTATQTVKLGGTGTAVTAVPNEGFTFRQWSDGVTQNPRTDVDVAADVSVTAEFLELFRLTYVAGPNGTVTGNRNQSIRAGGSGSAVTAVPAEGFGFVDWSDGRIDNPRTDTNVSADVNVTANFSSSVTVSYIAGPNGSLNGSATQQVNAGGATTPVTALPEEGYLFSQWSDGSIDNPRADVDVTASLSVEATFFKRPIMLPVPQSTFVMGARDDGDDGLVFGNDDEYPRHEVTLSSYEIGKYEVTAQEYCDFLNYAGHPARNVLKTPSGNPWRGHNNPLHFGPDNVPIMSPALPESMLKWVDGYFVPKTKIGLPGETEYNMENNPESAVTWYGAVVYCNWLSERDGFEPVYNTDTWEADWTKNGYHIPTEAQWERAAAWDGEKHWIYGFTSDTLDAGRDRCTYYNGFYDPPPDWDNTTFTNVLGLQQDAVTSYTNPVGWFNGINVSPNGNIQTVDSKSPIGAYDMSGNIMEWCHDWYSPTYYAESSSVDPKGPATGELRVMRGSGWHRWVGRFRVRTAVRFAFPALQVDGVWGFRLARTTGPTPEFTVNYTAGENGSITGTSPQIVDPGQSTTQVTAVPANGFGFVEWSDGRTDNPRTDINVREDIGVTAAFATAVTLTYVAGPNGTLEGDPEQVVGAGASGTAVSAVPGDGFIFLNWSDGSTENPRIDENATADQTVTANFVEAISLEYFAGPNGTLTGATSQTVALSGSGTEVSAVPESGFVFVDWSDGRTDNPRIDTGVEADLSVTANFGPE